MNAVVTDAGSSFSSSRSSGGATEYGNNPLSPPSVGLEPPNVSSPCSETSRDYVRRDRERVNSTGSVCESEVPLSPKPASVATKREHSSVAGSSSRGDDGSPERRDSFDSASGRKRPTSVAGEKRTATKVCRVCGDKAYSYNFNVITCESCKAFFRRNANKGKEIRCPFNDQCDINIVSRRFCQRCRLQKCFMVGMKKEWIMSEEARLEKKQRVQENRDRRMAESAISSAQGRRVAKHEEEVLRSSTPVRERSTIPSECAQVQVPPAKTPHAFTPVAPVASPVSVASPCPLPESSSRPPCPEAVAPSLITAAGFRPPVLPQTLPSTSLPGPSGLLQSSTSCLARSEQSFVDHVAQQVQFAQAQIQQHAAQLGQQLQQQAALAQCHASAQQFQQAGQLVAAQHQHQQQHQQQQQQQFAVAAAAVVAANTFIPATSPPVSRSVNVVPQLRSPMALTPLNLPSAQSVVPRPIQAVNDVVELPVALASESDTVTIPKETLMRLLGQQSFAGPSGLNSGGASLPSCSGISLTSRQPGVAPRPSFKCTCTCFCGRYRQGQPIVDEIMAEVLPNSATVEDRADTKMFHQRKSAEFMPSARSGVQWLQGNSAVNTSRDLMGQLPGESTVRTPRASLFKNTSSSLLEEEMQSIKVDPDCTALTSSDQDRLNELLNANGVWSELEPNSVDEARHKQGCPSKVDMVNMADGAIRRMIKMMKRIESFRYVDHRDQIQIFKNSCMQYIILRGAMSYDPQQNMWKGPSPKAGYNVRMDAMKDTQDNLFECSIRFYATFKEEWRTNESVMLLLGMLVIYNPEYPGLRNRSLVEDEYSLYRRILKKVLFSLCGQDVKRTNLELKGLLDKIEDLKQLNLKAQRMVHEVDSSYVEPLLLEMFEH